MMYRYTSSRGFTLLLATLTSALLLLLGATIFGLIKKEIILSSLGRDSQFAFYAADTASECALYWDLRHNIFATTTPYSGATCDLQSLGTIQFPGYGVATTFEYEPNGYCARASITKSLTFPRTVIYARGYNTTCAGIVNNPRTLERAVELTY
ncbi:MAG: hypothetical protein KBE09_03135 [Candidatus Pacebacteria bacterium]|nr:hypothetical protein [Candidatus Paceibacterota bacterium]